jgi:hypothetical protein
MKKKKRMGGGSVSGGGGRRRRITMDRCINEVRERERDDFKGMKERKEIEGTTECKEEGTMDGKVGRKEWKEGSIWTNEASEGRTGKKGRTRKIGKEVGRKEGKNGIEGMDITSLRCLILPFSSIN